MNYHMPFLVAWLSGYNFCSYVHVTQTQHTTHIRDYIIILAHYKLPAYDQFYMHTNTQLAGGDDTSRK